MNRILLLLLFCLSAGFARAEPVEDEPLPFDTRMPPRTATAVVPDAPGAERNVERADRASNNECRTVVRKVRGRKVRKQVCNRPAVQERKASASKKKAVANKAKARKVKQASNKKPAKSRKRR